MATVVTPEVYADRRAAVRAFMDEHVYPNEPQLFGEDEAADALIREIQQGEGRWTLGASSPT